MENSLRHSRASQLHSSTLLKQRRSGYEPSDTETELHENRWHDVNRKNRVPNLEETKEADYDLPRHNLSPLKINRRRSSKFECDKGSPPKVSPLQRRHSSKSPYKARLDEGSKNLYPKPSSDFRKNVSPLSKSEHRRHVSPYKPAGREEHKLNDDLDNNEIVGFNRNQSRRAPKRENGGSKSEFLEECKVSERPNYTRRSATAPRLGGREKEQQNENDNDHAKAEQKGERTPSPLPRNMMRKQTEARHVKKSQSIGEINELVANAKISRGAIHNDTIFESTESISQGDIFFSRDCTALPMRTDNDVLPKNGGLENHFIPKPPGFNQRESASHQRTDANGHVDPKTRGSSSSNGLSRSTMNSSSAVSRQSSCQLSTGSSKRSDASGTSSVSLGRFTANIRKSKKDAWFACMKKGTCRTKSPKRQAFDEASFIEKAFVVEKLRPFWADKHQPGSLNGFTCHKQEAQLLRQLVSEDIVPHILFKGPSGSGKRALTMALLREIYGDPCWNVTHELRHFQVQEKKQAQVIVPLTSSAHHVELNVRLEANAKYALMSLVKEISSNYAITPEVSIASLKADYKVIVLYEVDKAGENIQHLIKWIMDCYTDTCKLILCCEDDVDIIESVKSRCKVIQVDAPVTHEIMEVLIQIAKKEDFDLSMSFAAKLAAKSKQNVRQAIMALEACKAHNYPFVDDQPIPLGWEEVLIELAAEILADPSPNKLFFVRGKLQKLLVDFVHPKLILQKLVEQFLKRGDAGLKRETYYWHAYYEKRLPTGTTALLKLEEFVAKFMSIYKKSLA